ncbi:MAG: hypothetical protein ACRDOU_05165 [Streptosporangiaceae bacterium]
MLEAERHAALREAFTHLPSQGQALIAMLIADPPLPYAEISARLGVPVGSIGPTRSRYLDKIRRHPAIAALIVASADAHRPPGRESPPLGEDRLPTLADFEEWRDAYHAVAPDPTHFSELQAKTGTAVHEFRGWTDKLRSLQAPTLLLFGDRDFMPLPDVVEMFQLLPNAQLAVLPGATHMDVSRRTDEVLALITPFLDVR